MEAKLLPATSSPQAVKQEKVTTDKSKVEGKAECAKQPNCKGRAVDWLGGDDQEERESFMVRLSTQKLPMPQTESDWHAARIYVDSLQKSVYDVEQWCDYLSLKNKLPIDCVPRRRASTGGVPSPATPNYQSRGTSRRNPTFPSPPPKPPPPPGPPPKSQEIKIQRAVSQLVEMGFCDLAQNQAVVIACDGNFVVQTLTRIPCFHA